MEILLQVHYHSREYNPLMKFHH